MSSRANTSRQAVLLLSLAVALCAWLGQATGALAALPDGRAYELVTPLDNNGLEVGAGIPSTSGGAVDWEAPGGCCGATSAAETLYQSTRTGTGWQTKALTPTPNRPLLGTGEEQAPVFWSPDLSQTIFTTPASYAAGDERPIGSGDLDLYLQGPTGSLEWLSQGLLPGSGSAPVSATFYGASPDAQHVAFASSEPLTPDATPMNEANEITPLQYLYERSVQAGTTSLVNVSSTTLIAPAAAGSTVIEVATTASLSATTRLYKDDQIPVRYEVPQQITIGSGSTRELVKVAAVPDGTHIVLSTPLEKEHQSAEPVSELTNPYGAVLGNGGSLGSFLSGNARGTTSHAVSEDGSKLYFESPSPNLLHLPPVGELVIPHLYMHDSQTGITTALDDPLAAPNSRVDGPAGERIAYVPKAVFDGASQDGSLAFFTSNEMLTGGLGEIAPGFEQAPALGHEELYEFNSTDHQIGVAPPMSVVPVSRGSYGGTPKTTLTSATHVPALTSLTAPVSKAVRTYLSDNVYPAASTSLTGSATGRVESALTTSATVGATMVELASTAGFVAGQQVTIRGKTNTETATIEEVVDSTHLRLAAGLGHGYESGATITYNGDVVITVASTAGFYGEELITIGTGAAEQKAYIAAVLDSTELMLSAPLAGSDAAGTAVAHAGENVIIVGEYGAEFTAGLPITIGADEFGDPAETAMVASVSGNILTLSAPIAVRHITPNNGTPEVTQAGSTLVSVSSSAGFASGETLEIGKEKGAVVSSVPDGTHLLISTPLREGHAPGLEVKGADTTIAVASSTGFTVGDQIVVDSGDAAQTALISSIPDATHIEVNTLMKSHPAGVSVSESPIEDGEVMGETAISNDGSHVYFIAKGVLASNANAHGQRAVQGQPNLYVFDDNDGEMAFIATVAWPDISSCQPTCESPAIPFLGITGSPEENRQNYPGPLIAEPDTARPAVPTPDGSVFVFDSSGNLTGQDPGPATTLSAEGGEGERTITVGSTKGFAAGDTITVGSGLSEELANVEAVDDATHLTLTEINPAGTVGLYHPQQAGAIVTLLHSEVYRYDANANSLSCISCTAPGVMPTGSATLGAAGGGSYGPPMTAVPMSESGSEVFFQTPDPLVSEDVNGGSFANGLFGSLAESSDVYEWENGKVSLISDGRSTAGAFLDGTTPSGNDVFITTRSQLVGADKDEYADIYDARVGGGFPEPSAPPPPCSGQNCRPHGASVFFSVPASATVTGQGNLTPPSIAAPSFSVASISAAQRAKTAKSGTLALGVSATSGGEISVKLLASIHGRTVSAGSASVRLNGPGKATLTVHLNKAARKALAKNKRLALRAEVSYSQSATVKVATFTLRKAVGKQGRKATARRAVAGGTAGRRSGSMGTKANLGRTHGA